MIVLVALVLMVLVFAYGAWTYLRPVPQATDRSINRTPDRMIANGRIWQKGEDGVWYVVADRRVR